MNEFRGIIGALLAIAWLLSGAGCGGSGAPAKAVRDEVPTSKQAMRETPCTDPGQSAEPWTFDMDTTTRGALFRAMSDGLVMVSYDCNKLKVLTRCRAQGDYDYGGYPANFDLLEFQDADELRASLSGGALVAARFQGELERGSKLLIAHGEVGMNTTTVPDITKDQLNGSCTGATHFVSEIHFGAYAMTATSSAKIASAAEVFSQSASGKSHSSAERKSRSGDDKACEKASDKDTEPPSGCNTVVRVTLDPILPERTAEEKAAPPPARADAPRPPPPCPPGYARTGGVCRKSEAAPTRTCAPTDAQDCEKQCMAGDTSSCAQAGSIYEQGTRTEPDPAKAYTYYDKACKAGNLAGCTGVGYLLSKGEGTRKDEKRARQIFEDACRKGNGRACAGIGHQYRLKGQEKISTFYFSRGCRLGYARACYYEGVFGFEHNSDKSRVVKAYERACYGRDGRGCLATSALMRAGVGVAADPKRADLFKRLGLSRLEYECKQKDGKACDTLGHYHAGGIDPTVVDQATARTYFKAGCDAGQKKSCSLLRSLPRPLKPFKAVLPTPTSAPPPPCPPGHARVGGVCRKSPPPPPPPPPPKKPGNN